jgi:hypothetical protein
MPKNLGHIESLARSYTDTAIKTLTGIMMQPNCPPMARVAAAKVLLDRGWGKPKEMHHSEVDDNKTLKVVNEIVHVYETREQITLPGCCARTASGHAAAAPPSSVMNARRFIAAIIRSPRRRARATGPAPQDQALSLS